MDSSVDGRTGYCRQCNAPTRHPGRAHGEALPVFDGATFDPAVDAVRLGRQLERTQALMCDGAWRTLDEIAARIGEPAASVSARLRDLRKPKFGGHVVERRRRCPSRGLYEYRMKAAL